MHICFSTIDYHHKNQGGGIASYLDAICPSLVALGHKVTIVGPNKQFREFVNDYGVNILLQPLGSIHWYLYRLKFPSFIFLLVREWEWSNSLLRAIKRIHELNPIDVIESTESGIFNLVLNKKKLPPIVIRLHGSQYIFSIFSNQTPKLGDRILHHLELFLLGKVSALTAPSQFQANLYEKFVFRKVYSIPNPINKLFLLETKSKSFELHNPTILYTGRIELRKGSLLLLDALGILLKEFPNVNLVIAGALHNSISDSQLQNKIVETGMRNNIQILGHINFSDLCDYYRIASVFVMPSYYETFGISVIEAMSQGLPVVVSSAGSLPELISDNENGIIFKSGDIYSLVDALRKLLIDPTKAKAIGQNGRELVLKKYLPEIIAEQNLRLYNDLISC